MQLGSLWAASWHGGEGVRHSNQQQQEEDHAHDNDVVAYGGADIQPASRVTDEEEKMQPHWVCQEQHLMELEERWILYLNKREK